MAFFNNEHKREVKAGKPKARVARGRIPIESLNKLGCSVCPRDKSDLKSPKMEPSGSGSPLIYLLGSGPNDQEDRYGEHWAGAGGSEIRSKFDNRFFKKHVRNNHIVNCATHLPGTPGDHEIECCRNRVVQDIEDSKPLVVVGVGGSPLHWATGLPRNDDTFRGTLIATKIGRHVCWYYPILYPNYVERKKFRTNEFEQTLGHDIRRIEDLVGGELKPPTVYEAPFDQGMVLIDGQSQGDMQRLEDELHRMLSLPEVGLDIETNGLRPYLLKDPKIWTAAIGTFDRTVAFVVDHPEGWGTDTRMRKVRGMLGEFLLQSNKKTCHNLSFEQEWSAYKYGNDLLRLTEWDDTMAMAYALDAREGTKSLDVQCRVRFGFFLKAQSRVDVSQPNWITRYPVKDTLRYNGLDTKWTHKLATVLRLAMLFEDTEIQRVYEGRVRLAPTLVLTSARGMPIDFDYADDLAKRLGDDIAKIEGKARALPELKAYKQRFGEFEFTNPEHALKLMKDICHRPEVHTVDQNGVDRFSSDEATLNSIPADEVPSATLILEHRQLTRCVSTYLGPLLKGEMTGPDGMLHAEYSSMRTLTNRLSSVLHNWPKHKHKEVRGSVAARGGEWMVAADYGQIEFRVAGMLSGDLNLVKYCWTGYDVHQYWAERVVAVYGPIKDWIVDEFDVDWDEKGLKTLRQEMKNTWVFPQLFGATTRSCAARLHMPEDIADDLGGEFWDEFRGVLKWQERVMAFYAKHNYVETLGGFRRRGPHSRNELINMPIQGTACEIVLEAMNAISERALAEDNPELQPAFNGHDDLSYFISDGRLEENVEIIAYEMCKPRFDYINVPLKVEVSLGPRWHELQELAVYSSETLFNLRNPYK